MAAAAAAAGHGGMGGWRTCTRMVRIPAVRALSLMHTRLTPYPHPLHLPPPCRLQVLEMLSYLTYYGPSISERLWGLWPQIEAAVNEWAVDYWENILVPLDNFISRDTERFLTCTAPDYKASLFGMVRGALQGDYGERDVVPAAKLLEVVLQNCRGRVDAWVGPYLQLALGRLNTATNRTLKVRGNVGGREAGAGGGEGGGQVEQRGR